MAPLSKMLLKVGIIFYFALVSSYLFIFLTNPRLITGSDFVSFLTGGSVVRSGRTMFLYDVDTQFSHQLGVIKPFYKNFLLPFRSLPLVAYLFVPFTFISLTGSFYLFTAVNLLILLAAYKVLITAFPGLRKQKFVLPLILFACWPSVTALVLGQLTPIILLVFASAYVALKNKRFLAAGLLVAGLFIKLQYLVIFPYLFLLAENKKRFLAGFSAGALTVFLACLPFGGFSALKHFLPFLSLTETTSFGSRAYHMFTIYGLLQSPPFTGLLTKTAALFINIVLFVGSLVLFYGHLRRRVGLKVLYCEAIFLAVFFSLHSLAHDLLILVIPILFLIERINEGSKTGFIITLLLFIAPLTILTNSALVGTIMLLLAFYLFVATFGYRRLPERR